MNVAMVFMEGLGAADQILDLRSGYPNSNGQYQKHES
jgi:hypothetical protein